MSTPGCPQPEPHGARTAVLRDFLQVPKMRRGRPVARTVSCFTKSWNPVDFQVTVTEHEGVSPHVITPDFQESNNKPTTVHSMQQL